MNYYPYFPYSSMPVKTGFFKNIFNGFNFSNLLNGTQKTLNVVNQAIPLVKQAKPMFNNMKTMFRVMNEFKKEEPQNNEVKEEVSANKKVNNMPTFFQ